jgi:hypothetical protein
MQISKELKTIVTAKNQKKTLTLAIYNYTLIQELRNKWKPIKGFRLDETI